MFFRTALVCAILQLSCMPGRGQEYQIFSYNVGSPQNMQTTSFSGNQVPPSPCPRNFQYQYGQSGWTGQISIPTSTGIDPNTGGMTSIKLEVQLILPASLPTKYVGKLQLAESNEAVWQKLQSGSPNSQIIYTVYFPLTSPLPYLSIITANGNLICSGSIEPLQGRSKTIITLNHTFYPYSLSPNSGGRPFVANRPQIQPTRPPEVPVVYYSEFQGGRPNVVNQPQIEVVESSEVPNVYNPGISGGQSGGFQRPSVMTTTFNPPVTYVQQPTPATTIPTVSPVPNPVVQTPQTNNFPASSPIISQGSCGKPLSTNFLIVNGDAVSKRGEWPWMVAIFQNINDGVGIKFYCGGTLISKYYVLTAAHCTKFADKELTADKFTLYLGKFNLNKWAEPGAQTREVKNVFVHPDYNSSADADIAMLELSISAEIGPYVQPACLWPSNLSDLGSIVGKLGTVVGWGLDENNKITSSVPKQAKMPVVSQEECLRSEQSFTYFTSSRTFCAGYRNGTGPCNGDSGGGLVFPMPDEERSGVKWFLRGVVSTSLLTTGTVLCDLKNYVIFTDIAKHGSWMSQFVGI